MVVVGAGLGGGRTCAALRAAGFEGELTLVGAEQHAPYDRPPLTKGVLTQASDPDLGLDLAELRVDFLPGVRATGLDLAQRTLATDAGEQPHDALVLATGASPIRLPGDGPQVTIRTLDDAVALRDRLRPGSRLAIIGAGWIGAEIATAAVGLGAHVTCLEGADAPLAGPLGSEVGRLLLPWWHDVDLRLGVQVASVERDGVRLVGGELVPADTVLTAIGVRPEVGWLAHSGLEMAAGGVAVDSDRRTSDPHVYAIGDAAARWSDSLAARVHSGHWDEAVNGAIAVAATIVGKPQGLDEVPYFWSDQFGRKIQYVGQHRPSDTLVMRTHDDPAKWGAAWLDDHGRLTAHVSVGFPRAMVGARMAIQERRPIDPERCRDLAAAL